MSKKYSACIIGTGRIGFTLGYDKKREQPASHTMALLNNPNVKIIAGCDKDEELLSQWKSFVDSHFTQFSFKKSNQVKTFNSIEELFNNCSADIVVIAVNEDSHLETALYAISKKPRLIILEKPVALNSVEGKKILSQSKKYSVPVLVNHERRFAKDYALAREYIKTIGEVQKINANLFSGMRLYDPKKESNGGYSLLHDGTHLVDIVLYFLESLGESKLVNPIVTGICKDKKERDVIRGITVNYSTKAVSDIAITMSGRSRFFAFEVEIIGTQGRIKIGNGYAEFYKREESKLYTGFYSLNKDKSVKIPKKTGYFSQMVKNAVEYLDGKENLKSTLETGLNALKVLEDIKYKLNPKSFKK